jgi:thymidylate synthase (FAD)
MTIHNIKRDVLDKGYVRLIETLGDDLKPVNAAKVSYNKESKTFGKNEERLLGFLGREDHTSPFRHALLQFEVYAPLMVARQWWKYIIGSGHKDFDGELQDPFTAWNESSRRYITEKVEFYIPNPHEWRSAPENSKQGSGEPVETDLGFRLTTELVDYALEGQRLYEQALADGVAAEQARLFLPAYGLYVRWYWTASLQGVAHFLNQRLAHDSQKEIQEFAQTVQELTATQFPNAIKEMLK